MSGVQPNAASGMAVWPQALQGLLSPATIRARCANIFATIERGESPWFAYDQAAMVAAAAMVAQVARERFGDGPVAPHSRWQHFAVGGRDRVAALWREGLGTSAGGARGEGIPSADDATVERARALVDLVITSVLLDAGAGATWGYTEADGLRSTRSEGLAVASLHWFASGGFSAHSGQPRRADGKALAALRVDDFRAAFQVTAENPIVGEARYELLVRLGERMLAAPAWFTRNDAGSRNASGPGGGGVRLGGFIDWALTQARRDADGVPTMAATEVLGWVLQALGPIWPSRLALQGQPLGDVWRHDAAGGEGETAGLVPFHKLSQWLSYSLFAPLEVAGVRVVGIDQLTGLPEYRNGGFLVDTGVLRLGARAQAEQPFAPSHPCIIEWRAATVTLLDRLLPLVRVQLGKGDEFTLPMMLEAGTWECGRRLAAAARGGIPPLDIVSDGTVF